MKHGGTDAHECRSGKNGHVGGRHGKSQQTDHRDAHADGERVRLRPAVGVEAHDRLEQRSGQLQRKCNAANLSVIQMEAGFQQGINGGDQRLHRVIQKVAKADGKKNRKYCLRRRFGARLCLHSVQICAARHLRP